MTRLNVSLVSLSVLALAGAALPGGCDRRRPQQAGRSRFLSQTDLRKLVESSAPPGLSFSFASHGMSGSGSGDGRLYEADATYTGAFHFRSADGRDVSCTAEHLDGLVRSLESQLKEGVRAAGGHVEQPLSDSAAGGPRRFSFSYLIGDSTGTVTAVAEHDDQHPAGGPRLGRLKVRVHETTTAP